MPNYIQYSTQIPSGSLKKGNAALGITNEVTGPTSTTGWYSGINPQSGSYVVYEVAASGDPDIYCPINSTELINLVRSKGATGGNTGSVAAALAWIATQNNLLATNEVYPNIVTSGLAMILDAGFVGSYPTTASTWYDISGNNISGSLINGPTFNINGAIIFDGVDDNVNCGNNTNPLLNPGPSEAWSLSATFKNSQSLPNDNAIYGIAGKRVQNDSNGYILMLRGGIYNGVLARLSTSGQTLVDILPTTNYSTILANGQYHQMVMTYGTNDTGSLYIDGVLVGQAVAPNFDFNNSNSAFKIGVGDTNNAHPFNGSINSVSFYNRALSQTEILQNYYQAPIVTNGLVFAVDAGNLVSYESGSTSTYSMTGSVTGSLINGVNYNSGNNGSWVFDGVDDNINFGDVTTTEFGTGNFTLSAWIYIPTNVVENTNFYKGLIVKKGAGAAQAGYAMYYNTGQQKFLWSTANGSSAAERFSTNTWGSLKGTWANVVMVRQSGATNNGHFYINGVYESIAPSATVLDVNSDFNLRLGSGNLYGGYFFQGNIADAKIYNRALSTSEVQQNFNAQKTRFGF